MPKKKSTAYMTPGEQIAGTVFFMIYLLVLPFAAPPLFRIAGGLLGGGLLRRMPTRLLHGALGLLILYGGLRLMGLGWP